MGALNPSSLMSSLCNECVLVIPTLGNGVRKITATHQPGRCASWMSSGQKETLSQNYGGGNSMNNPLAVHVKLHIYDLYTYESEHIHREREMAWQTDSYKERFWVVRKHREEGMKISNNAMNLDSNLEIITLNPNRIKDRKKTLRIIYTNDVQLRLRTTRGHSSL